MSRLSDKEEELRRQNDAAPRPAWRPYPYPCNDDTAADRYDQTLPNRHVRINYSGPGSQNGQLAIRGNSKQDFLRNLCDMVQSGKIRANQLDLKGVSAAGADLSKIPNLRVLGSALAQMDLSGADLSGLDLSNMKLAHFHAPGANLAGTKFSGSDLSDANFEGALFGKTDFSGASLAGAHMNFSRGDVIMNHTNVGGAEVAGAQWHGTAHNTGFDGIHGRGLDIGNLRLSGSATHFKGAHLQDVAIHPHQLPYISGATITGTRAAAEPATVTNGHETGIDLANYAGVLGEASSPRAR